MGAEDALSIGGRARKIRRRRGLSLVADVVPQTAVVVVVCSYAVIAWAIGQKLNRVTGTAPR